MTPEGPIYSDPDIYDSHERQLIALKDAFTQGRHQEAEAEARSLLSAGVEISYYHRGRLHLLLANISGSVGDAEAAVRLLTAFRDWYVGQVGHPPSDRARGHHHTLSAHLHMAETRLRELRAGEEPMGAPAGSFPKIPHGPWAWDFRTIEFDRLIWDCVDIDMYRPPFIPLLPQTTFHYANGAARSRRLSQTGLYEDETLAADGGKKRRTDD
ncbi:hypothetical protein CSOJ01_02968 [Colletotrichum sojae]|uniref:Uncharacterized protein n=1 Tax=Colletotrichum sojae TaxID=2175907 RepID=A0A8H6JPB8_9PEZI|nr:hypothetical protein CSOJ01_02968 [Colletotrichum sojae]